ncbi:MAG: nucleotidyltransferase domain-containing protein [Nitrospirota bacterium]|mgnify:FL=1|jgi:predicted nucleotidyltransferase
MSPFVEKRFFPKQKVNHDEKKRLTAVVKKHLLEKPAIAFAYIHGSFVTAESFRDIDVAIYTSESRDFQYESDLSYELSAATGYDVEVRIINNAAVAFQSGAIESGKLLFSRNETLRTDFIEDVGRRYIEYAHFRNIFMEAVSAKQ